MRFESDHPLTDEACKSATGKTFEEWYAYFDAMDGLTAGRRALNLHLYGEQKLDAWWCTTLVVEYEKARDQKKKDGLYEGYFICSTKTISAPVEKVFAAWQDPKLLAQWFGADVKAEVKEDGDFVTAAGTKGKFGRIRENKDIRLTIEGPAFTAPTPVEVQFQEKGPGKTSVLVNHTRLQTRAEADGVRNEWADALAKLKPLCEG